MKELEPKNKDEVLELRQTPESFTQTKIGSMRIKRGHKLFMINKDTLEIKEAEYEMEAVSFSEAENDNVSVKRKLVTQDGWFYYPALNKRNAYRKHLNTLNIDFDNP